MLFLALYISESILGPKALSPSDATLSPLWLNIFHVMNLCVPNVVGFFNIFFLVGQLKVRVPRAWEGRPHSIPCSHCLKASPIHHGGFLVAT